MALDKLVDSTQLDSDLTSVANAIRTKGGTSAQLAFPTDFVSAINAISGGGGYTNDDFADPTKPVGVVVSTATSLLPAMFYQRTGITKFTGNSVTGLNNFNYAYCHTFYGCTSLEEVELPSLTTLQDRAQVFRGCTSLRKVNLSSVKVLIGGTVFYGCTSLEGLVLPSAFSDPGNQGTKINSEWCRNCSSMAYFDTAMAYSIEANAFNGCTALNTLVIRHSPNTNAGNICTLLNVNALTGTPFAVGGTGGTLYVPSAKVSDYQTATNWSTLYNAGTLTVSAIEGSYYETHWADGTAISS